MQFGFTTFGIILLLVFLEPQNIKAHVSLTYPPARKYDLDFLDTVRTQPPCGMPKGKLVTRLAAGLPLNISWHLAYPHRGGFRLELLDKDGTFLLDLIKRNKSEEYISGDPTAQWHTVTIPSHLICTGCIIRLRRQASEWSNSYGFWSCADVDIVEPRGFVEDCSGSGTLTLVGGGAGCVCDRGSWGPRCQYKDDCDLDADCGLGKCVDLGGTSLPRKQCFCPPGSHGVKCHLTNKDELATKESLDLGGHKLKKLSKEMSLHYKIIPDVEKSEDEIEFVLIINGTSYGAIGWRPLSLNKSCKLWPNVEENVKRLTKRETFSARYFSKPNPTLLRPLGDKPLERSVAFKPKNEKSKSPKQNQLVKEPCYEPEPESEPEKQKESLHPNPEPESETEPSPEPEKIQKIPKHEHSQDESKAEPSAEPEKIGTSPENEHSVPELESEPEKIDSSHQQSSKSEHQNEIAAEPEPESEAESEPNAEPENEPSSEPEKDASKSAEKSSQPQSEPHPESEAESEPESIPETESEPKSEPHKESDLSNPGSESGSEPEPEITVKGSKSGKKSFAPKGDFHAMDCTDLVIGAAILGSYSRILDYYTRDRSTPRLDEFWDSDKGSDSISSATGWQTPEGQTVLIFRRKLMTLSSDPTDHDLGGELNLIWARGQQTGHYVHKPSSGLEKEDPAIPNFYAEDELKYHGHGGQRGVLFINFAD